MNNQEMFDAINKGIPSFEIIELSAKTMLEECSSDKVQLSNEYALLRKIVFDRVSNIVGWNKAYSDYLQGFRIITDIKTSEARIHISPNGYLSNLKNALNIKNPSLDYNDRELNKELYLKLRELRNIKSSVELKAKFPLIYSDYILSYSSYAKIKDYERKHSPVTPDIQAVIDNQISLYRHYGLDTDFKEFIEKQTKLYNRMISQKNFVERTLNETFIDLRQFTGLDKEKFELYLADKYLDLAINAEGDELKQQLLYYVTTYIRETIANDIVIKNDCGKEVTFKQLLSKYKRFLKKNPIIKPLDEERSHFENYHKKHVENHVKKYFITGVNWQIVPPGVEDTEFDKKAISALNRRYNYLSLEERKAKIKERYEIYYRKKRFFDNSGYKRRILGINTFFGYVAYVYPNGEILMEKYFDDEINYLPTKNEAIYNLHAVNFEALSKLDKITLMSTESCSRIIHQGNWEEKAQAVIDRPATPESEEAVKKLILSLEQKKVE